MNQHEQEKEWLKALETKKEYSRHIQVWTWPQIDSKSYKKITSYREDEGTPRLHIELDEGNTIDLTDEETIASETLGRGWGKPYVNEYLRICRPIVIDNSRLELHLAPISWELVKIRERVLGVNQGGARQLEHYPKEANLMRNVSERYCLNAIGVRVLFITKDLQIAFQKRSGGNNTFPNCWELSASGYIDPMVHNEDGRIRASTAMRIELGEELCIADNKIPFEHGTILGLVRNTQTGHTDLFGCIQGSKKKQDLGISETSDKVSEVRWLTLNDTSTLESFLTETGKDWVPQAKVSLKIIADYLGLSVAYGERSRISLTGLGAALSERLEN